MSKLDEKINEFLDGIYPNEPLWRNKQRFRTIKNYAIWSIKSGVLEKIDSKKK